jgi:hypothetical protein
VAPFFPCAVLPRSLFDGVLCPEGKMLHPTPPGVCGEGGWEVRAGSGAGEWRGRSDAQRRRSARRGGLRGVRGERARECAWGEHAKGQEHSEAKYYLTRRPAQARWFRPP